MRDSAGVLQLHGGFIGSSIGNSRVKLTKVKDRVQRGLVEEGKDLQQVAAEEVLQHFFLFADGRRAKARAAAEQEDPLWSSDWTDVAGAMRRQPPAEALPAEVFAIHDTPTWLAGMEKRRGQASRAGKEKLAQRIGREISGALRLHPSLAGGAPAAGVPAGGPNCDDHPDDADPVSVESIYGVDWSTLGSEQSVHGPQAVAAY